MILLGIDPGKSGAVARLDAHLGGLDLELWRDFEHEYDLVQAVVEAAPGCQHVAIEGVHSMPQQGVASSFTFGYWTGAAVGACKGLGMAVHRPNPQAWQRGVGADKDRSREAAVEAFPAYAEFFRRVKDHGSADAALMALWLARQLTPAAPQHRDAR